MKLQRIFLRSLWYGISKEIPTTENRPKLSPKAIFLFFTLLFILLSPTFTYAYDWTQSSQAEFEAGTSEDLDTSTSSGDVLLEIETLPQPSASTQEATFAAQNSEAVGILATDGTYLYTKSWSTYDGNDRVISKIGTGYGGTTAATDYGDLHSGTVGASLSLAYYDGYVYNGYTSNGQNLQRVEVATGTISYVNLAGSLLARNTGNTFSGSSNNIQITSDETYIYDMAYSRGSGYNGWRIRVFDPNDDFSVVGTYDVVATSYYSDGSFSDGTYFYVIEWGGSKRISRIGPMDFSVSTWPVHATWTSDQASTSVINGQYDWVNNKVWLGDLVGPDIYRYQGMEHYSSGNIISSQFDAGEISTFDTIEWTATIPGTSSLKFQLRAANDSNGSPDSSSWTDWLGPTSTGDFYDESGEEINADLTGYQWLQYKSFLESGSTPTLEEVTLNYTVDEDQEGPTFTNFSPEYANQDTVFNITCYISDTSGVYDDRTGSSGQGVYLFWATNAGMAGSQEIQMSAQSVDGDGRGTYITDASVPAQANGTIVYYQVYAYDNDYDGDKATDRTQNYSAVQHVTVADKLFQITTTSPQEAGTAFNITLTAKINSSGTITTDSDYNGTANLVAEYVSPTSGTKLLTPTSCTFTAAVTTVSLTYPDCGTITITATDSLDTNMTGTSDEIIFRPASFTISVDSTTQTVSQEFELTITAKNASGETTPNFNEDTTISVTYVDPTNSDGTISPTSVGGTSFSSGSYTMTTTYNRVGTITIRAAVTADTTKYGDSEEITFIPHSFQLSIADVPEDRTFFYINESIPVTVQALDYNSTAITNYTGSVHFLPAVNVSLPSDYTFITSDNGSHQFTVTCTEAQTFNLTLRDATYTSVTGTSDNIVVDYGKIKVISKSASVGTTTVQVQIQDSAGAIISTDNSTTFTVYLSESSANDSAYSSAASEAIQVTSGVANITLSDTEPEIVTVTPSSSPYLEPVAGEVNFGGVGDEGIRVLYWEEKK